MDCRWSRRGGWARCGVILLSVGVFSPAAELIRGIPLTDFEDAVQVTRGGEGLQPETTVGISAEAAVSGRHAARLAYRFRTDVQPRQYVEAQIHCQVPGEPRAIAFQLRGDGSGQRLKLRLTDSSGEVFQFGGAPIDWTGWREIRFDLQTRPEVSWGGDGNGRLDPPLRLVSVLVDSPVRPGEGVLFVDDLVYDAEGSPSDFLQITCRSPVLGNAFYGPPPSWVLELRNPLREPLPEAAFALVVRAADGSEAGRTERRLALGAGQSETVEVSPSLRDYGLYHAEVVHGERRQVFPFSWLPHSAAQRPDPTSPFGVSMHFGHGGRGPLENNLRLASDLGIRWVRDDATWAAIEKERGRYAVPPTFDRFLRMARSEFGCEPLIILDYGNTLYEPERAIETAEGREAFAAWSEYMARTYRHYVRYWEVWNEPNISGFWKPQPNPKAYALLLKETYAAVKRGNPDAVVVAMSTAGIDLAFIEAVLKEGTVGSFDAVSVHPYRYPTAPEAGTKTMLAHLQELVDLLARHGAPGTPIYNTEVGWPNQDDPRGLPEQTSANYLARMYTQLHAIPDIKATFWYDFQNDGTKREYNEHNFGLLHHDFTPKAPAVAYRMTAMALEGCRFLGALEAGSATAFAYHFQRADGKDVVAAWTTLGTGCIATRWRGHRLEAISAAGPMATPTLQDSVSVTALSETPVFLVGDGPVVILPPPLQIGPIAALPRARATLTATLSNPWSRNVAGHVALSAPAGWGVPEPIPVDLPAGGTASLSVSVSLPAEAEPGRVQTVAAQWRDAAGALVGEAVAAVTILAPAEIDLDLERREGKLWLRLTGTTRLASPPAIAAVRIGMPPAWGAGERVETAAAWNPAADAAEGMPTASLERRFSLGDAPLNHPGLPPAPVVARVSFADGNTVARTKTLGLLSVRRATIAVDGDTADWDWAKPIAVEDFDGPNRDAWSGPADGSARVRLAWDDRFLYLAATVTDDVHSQPFSGGDAWKGDGIQLAIAAVPGAGSGAATPTEIGLALTAAGPEVYRWTDSAGLLGNAVCAVLRTGTATVYEAALPWTDLGVRPEAGAVFSLALIVNDKDDGDREGWLRLFDGIGWRKDPRLHGRIMLGE